MRYVLLLTTILLFGLPLLPAAQPWTLQQKLGSADAAANDHFGISVAVSDSFLIVGAWGEDGESDTTTAINGAGAAYIYRLRPDGQWVEAQKLISPNREALGYFGFYVAIDGEQALVGAYNEDHSGFGNAGAVYAYHREPGGRWVFDDRLLAADPADADYFGRNVALAGDYALIGAYNHDLDEDGANDKNNAGAAYLFKRQADNSWTQLRKLVAPDREAEDQFGKYLDLDEHGLVIGAFNKNESAALLHTGAAYAAYVENSSDLEHITSADLQKLTPSDQDNLENFGWDVAISGEWTVIGKHAETDQPGGTTGARSGAAYFFQQNNGQWTERQKVYASDFSSGALFGRAIAIDGAVCVIGAGGESEDEAGGNTVPGAGAAYVFELQADGDWQAVQKLAGTQRGANDLFGEDAVDVSGPHIVVGAWLADTVAAGVVPDGGAAYVFERDSSLTATREPIANINFTILNNPSADGLLRAVTTPLPLSVRVFSLNGQLLYGQDDLAGPTLNVNLAHLPPAVYVVQVRRVGERPLALKWVKM